MTPVDPGQPIDPAEPDPAPLLAEADIAAGYQAARDDIGQFNLGVFGLTGVGKSTLVNAVFGADLAQTGIGDPVTRHSRLYRHETSTMGLYDTKGLEIGDDSAAVLADLRRFVEANRLGDPRDQIHVIWYAVRAGTRRIQPGEAQFLVALAGLGIPVLLVMTQTPVTGDGGIHPEARELADAITRLRLPVRGPVRFVNALGDDFAGIAPFGLPELLDDTAALAPEGVRTALAAAQRVSRNQKRAQADVVIKAAQHRVRSRLFLHGLGKEWARMFAALAAIYDMTEAQSRAVLDQVRTVARLRRLLRLGSASATIALFGPAAALTVGRRLRRRPATDPADPTDLDPDAAGPDDDIERRRRVRSGLAAGQVTGVVGQTWADTCEAQWAAAYPDPPDYHDVAAIAERFSTDLAGRLPRVLRRVAPQ